MANIGNLQIFINPTTAATGVSSDYLSNHQGQGQIVFDEKTKLIHVRGASYGLSDEQATQLTGLLSDVAAIKGSSTGVSISGILDQISGINTAIEGIQSSAIQTIIINGVTGVGTGVSFTFNASNLTYEDQTSIKSKIEEVQGIANKAVTSVNDKTGAITLDATDIEFVSGTSVKTQIETVQGVANSAIQTITINDTTLSKATGSITLNAETLNYSEAATGVEALSIKGKIDTLETTLNTLAGTGISAVVQQIDDIKAELSATGSEGLSTIIDNLRTLQTNTDTYQGITNEGLTPNEGTSPIGLQTSLQNLATYTTTGVASAKEYADTKATGALGSAVTYTDQVAAGVATGAYNAASTAQANAQTYTDTQVSQVISWTVIGS